MNILGASSSEINKEDSFASLKNTPQKAQSNKDMQQKKETKQTHSRHKKCFSAKVKL